MLATLGHSQEGVVDLLVLDLDCIVQLILYLSLRVHCPGVVVKKLQARYIPALVWLKNLAPTMSLWFRGDKCLVCLNQNTF